MHLEENGEVLQTIVISLINPHFFCERCFDFFFFFTIASPFDMCNMDVP